MKTRGGCTRNTQLDRHGSIRAQQDSNKEAHVHNKIQTRKHTCTTRFKQGSTRAQRDSNKEAHVHNEIQRIKHTCTTRFKRGQVRGACGGAHHWFQVLLLAVPVRTQAALHPLVAGKLKPRVRCLSKHCRCDPSIQRPKLQTKKGAVLSNLLK